MAGMNSRQIGGNLIFHRDGHQHRLLDAFGPDVVKYVEDFVRSPLTAADAPLGWVVTLVEAGAGESTITCPDEVGGALLLTTDAAENDGINMQLDGESFELTSDQSAVYFGIRMKSGEATQSDFLVGLCITDTDLLGGMTDGVYFRKVDGSTSVAAVTEKNSTETETAGVHTFAADTYVELEFYVAGGAVYFYVNGALVATHMTNVVDDEAITPSIHFLTGNAAVETMTVDWVRAIQIGR